jgi:aminomethyltransferase
LLNENGGVLDDLVVYRLAEEEYMLVVNGACRESDFAAIRSRLPQHLALIDISDRTGKIDLQGPASLSALETLLPGNDWTTLPYFGLKRTSYRGDALLVSRTGYTGELGYELYIAWEKTEQLWTACLALPDVVPAGLGARDTLRLEVGLPLYGQDLDAEHTPSEAGYASMLSSVAPYVGRDNAMRVHSRLVGLSMPGRRSARHHDSVMLPNGQEVGTVTSASFAPSLGHAVALAYITADQADAPSFLVCAAKTELTAVPVPLPFYSNGTARKKL